MSSSGIKVALVSVAALLSTGLVVVAPAEAAPPANDAIANAQVLTGPGTVTGTNVDATAEVGEPAHYSGVDAGSSVWYSWTSPDEPDPAPMQVWTRDSDFDTVLAVYSGGPAMGSLVQVASGDDYGEAGGASRVQFTPDPATTYYIAVDGYGFGGGNAQGSITLRLAEALPEGSIEGHVTDGADGIDDICVAAVDDNGDPISLTGYTDASGYYIVNAVPAGTDRHLRFWNCGSTTFAGEFYGDAQTIGAAADIVVQAGVTTSGIDAVLDDGGAIFGTITADGPDAPSSLAGICVRATMVGAPDDGFTRQVQTGNDGDYLIEGLDGGSYRVRFGGDCGPNGEVAVEFYDDVTDTGAAELVEVTEGDAVTGINAGLGAAPGQISGTAREWQVGPGIANICVRAVGPSFTSPSVNTDANGDYTIPNVPAGTDHLVRFSDCHASSNPYTTQWFEGALAVDDAKDVTVTPGHTTGDVDASMFRAATLGGQVTDTNGNPRDPACVNVYNADDDLVTNAEADDQGIWSAQVPPGNYKIEVHDCGGGGLAFETRWYLDATSSASANVVFVDQGDVEDQLDQVTPGVVGSPGRIVGRVTDDSPAQNPLEGICVEAHTPGATNETQTDAQGRYAFGGLDPGNYQVSFTECAEGQPLNLLPQWWQDAQTWSGATPVVVSGGTTTSGIIARMHQAAAISGTVTNELGQPVEGICVTAYLEDHTSFGEVYTDASGEYTLKGLDTAPYLVSFEDCTYEYIPQWYEGAAFPDGDPTPVWATEGETTTGIDAELARYATISGTVTDEAGQPLENVCVWGESDDDAWTPPWYGVTDENGEYLLGGLLTTTGPENEYAVRFSDCGVPGAFSYGEIYYEDAFDAGTAHRFAVTLGDDITGIDTVLQSEDPVNTDDPSVTGRANVGVRLRAANGTWEHQVGAFGYQWYRCQADGTDCLAVDGEVERSYHVSEADAGHRLRVDVTAQNSYGSTTVASGLTGVVDDTAPPNDDIVDRQELVGGLPIQVEGDNTDATREPGEPDHYGFTEGASVWYEWTAPSAADAIDMVSISLAGSDYDTTLSVYDGTPTPFSGLELVAEDDESAGNHASAVAFAPVPDTTYYIAVDGYYDTTTHSVDTGSIQMELAEASGIAGTVLDQSDDPVRDICVDAVSVDPDGPEGSTNSAADGTYFIALPPGDYVVGFTDCGGVYGDQWYDGVDDPDDATSVTVVAGTIVPGIDAHLAELAPFGSIAGTVTNEDGDPIPDICVLAVTEDYTSGSIAYTDENGTYLLRGLADPDHPEDVLDYVVAFTDCTAYYGDEFYDNQIDPEKADLVAVALDQEVTGIDAVLQHDPPDNTVEPSVSGSPYVGQVLTADVGEWTHEPSEFTYQWFRCDDDGDSCDPIDDAVDATYTLAAADAGGTVYVEVTAYNSIGDAPADSAVTDVVQDRPQNVTLPSVSGTLAVGGTVSIGTGTWTGSPSSYGYQWMRCSATGTACAAISGQTTHQYTTTSTDVGHKLRVNITATNPAGATTVLSYSNGVIGAPSSVTPGTITGPSSVGAELSVTNGSWTGAPTSYAQQWMRCNTSATNCVAIPGATGSTYTTTTDDVGHKLRVTITATNAVGSTSALSYSNGVIGTPSSVTPGVISGANQVGVLLTVTNGTWTGSPTSYAQQWMRCNADATGCVTIPGETASSYTTTTDDLGHKLRVTITAANAIGSASALSYSNGVIGAPTSAGVGSVTGPNTVGATLTISTSGWADPPSSVDHQWMRCRDGACDLIDGETGMSYTTTSSDLGYRIRVEVTATNDVGATVVRSYAAGIVGAPTAVRPATITGVATSGTTLHVTDGAWTASPTSFTYQWLRCNTSAIACVAIPGETGAAYTAGTDDVGHKLRVDVTASNTAGGSTARSYSNGVIAP